MGRVVSKMMDIRSKKFYEKLFINLNPQSGDKIFEIGYGPGLGINMLARHYKGCKIYGVDFSSLMYEIAAKRNKSSITDNIVKLYKGDLLTIDVGNDKYDKIFCVNVIYFWDDLYQVFDRIYSILNDNGLFCIFMEHEANLNKMQFAENFKKYTIDEVETVLKKTGFNQINSELTNGYYIKAHKKS